MLKARLAIIATLTFMVTSTILVATAFHIANGRNLEPSGFVLAGVAPMATQDNVSSNGVGPTTISLTWAVSRDPCFTSYTLAYSTSGAPGSWNIAAVITDPATNSDYYSPLIPGQSYWWQVNDTDCPLGNVASSNVIRVTQPANATLSFTRPSATSAQFSWTNNAQYGGHVAFGYYQLMESVNGASYAPATTISSQTSMSFTINGLSAGTHYSFYVATTDQCNGCSAAFPSSSNSNIVSFTTTASLSATASAQPASVAAGQAVTFTCAGAGGTAPYTYSWTFGDGASGIGQNPTHTYTSSGSINAVCTVQDSTGATAKSATVVAVTGSVILGLPSLDFYALIVGVVVLGGIIGAVVMRRRKTAPAPIPEP